MIVYGRPFFFVPEHPQAGDYAVWSTPESIDRATSRDSALGPLDWRVTASGPLDAFGRAGSYDRSAVSRLYRGRLATVARGWIQRNGQVETYTLISPYPDATLSRLEAGTLIIRFTICCT